MLYIQDLLHARHCKNLIYKIYLNPQVVLWLDILYPCPDKESEAHWPWHIATKCARNFEQGLINTKGSVVLLWRKW